MAWLSLLFKDLREHTVALTFLMVGFVLVVSVVLQQNRSGTFSLSGLQVVRFALITVIPLITFIVGNRLIAREYIGGTRQFIEALPIMPAAQLIQKYLFGLFFLLMLGVLLVWIAVVSSSAAELIDERYMLLVLTKTLAVIVLYWSIVFCFSFTGPIRLVLYIGLALSVMFLINLPTFDASRLGPIGVMDPQLFVFERTEFPVQDLIETFLIALAFTLVGFLLALVNEGSLVERLSKPISMRDFAAVALLGIASFGVYSTVKEKWDVPSYEFSSERVLRSETTPVSVMYLSDDYRDAGEAVLQSLQTTMGQFQTDLGLARLPTVRVSLDTNRERTDIDPRLISGVLINANYVDFDSFELANMGFMAMHHTLLNMNNNRLDYETRHWVLDGLARWWAEGAANSPSSPHNPELLALAVFAKDRLPDSAHPLLAWQTITDTLGFELADALSYSAILYLQERLGKEAVFALATDYLSESVASNSLESLRHMFHSDVARFKSVTGLPLDEFLADWLVWLDGLEQEESINAMLIQIPRLQADVESVTSNGIPRLQVQYRALDNYVQVDSGVCVLRHQYHSAYDEETMMLEKERDRQPCEIGTIAHDIYAGYAPGDRAYVVVEFETESFHRPVPLWIGRINIQ